MGGTSAWTDPNFPANKDAIYWTDFPRSGSLSLAYYGLYAQWYRPTTRFTGVSLFQSSIGAYNSVQGSILDCYLMSSVGTMAEASGDRIRDLFINKDYPTSQGLVAMRVFVKGKPQVVTIDDYLPFVNGNLQFARRPGDGSLWGPMVEKAWAKVNGNYEDIGSGWQAESWRVLNGAPSKFIMASDYSYRVNDFW